MASSIDIQVNPYLQGQVFDSTPYVNFYLQQERHRQAKEAAFDGYLNDLQKNVTPTGMRNQDVPAFTNKANEWMQFGIQNKKYIQNPALDGGKARSEFLGRHQELLGYTAASKNEFEKSKMLQPIKNDPDKLRRVNKETLDRWGRSNKSIFDPEFQTLDTTDVGYERKPFDVASQTAYEKHLINGLETKPVLKETIKNPNDPLSLIDRYEYRHNDTSLKTIANRGIAAFNSDPTIHDDILGLKERIMPKPSQYDKTKLDVPPEFHTYNDTFKKVMGRDMSANDEDVAAADALVRSNKYSVEEKSRPNEMAKMTMQENKERRMAGLHFGLSKQLAQFKSKLDKGKAKKDDDEAANLIDDYMGRLNASGKDTYHEMSPNREVKFEGKVLPQSIAEQKSFSKQVGTKTYAPDKLVLLPDGSYRRVFYELDPNGKTKISAATKEPVIDTQLSDIISPDQAKVNLADHFFSGKIFKQEAKGKATPTGNKITKPSSRVNPEELRNKYKY